MVVGYVRLSKDDNKKDYISIENQKLILTQYSAQMGLSIERWYEDDGVSGYTFERPGFLKLLSDLEKDVTVILAKDLSRIGRHNARVLLFLEEIKEMGKRLLLADDTYDSFAEEDDTIGIRTWYNERYVKDTSKKIKKAMKARQIDGTLAVNTPIGYRRNTLDKTKIEVDDKAARYIRNIFALYLSGNGFRAIAEILTKEGIPTASILEKERMEALGKHCNKRIALHWSPKMVGEIIKNDIYIGNLRYHKNERVTVHGKDKKVEIEDQIVFYGNHPAIVDPDTFETAQKILKYRIDMAYRGKPGDSENKLLEDSQVKSNKYRGLLYCDSCKGRMTAIHRRGKKPYYLCSNYNSKGKLFCNQAVQIAEMELDEVIVRYRDFMLNCDPNMMTQVFHEITDREELASEERISQLIKECKKEKEELKYLLLQKIRNSALAASDKDVIDEALEELKNYKVNNIKKLSEQINELREKSKKHKTKYKLISNDKQEQHEIIQQKNMNLCNISSTQSEYDARVTRFELDANVTRLELDANVTRLELDAKVTRLELDAILEKILIEADGSIRIFLKHRVYETGWYATDGIRIHFKEAGD